MSHDSGNSNGCAGWLKWLVGIVVALLAAGGGIVALLNYISPPPPSLPVPPQVTSSPQATESPQVWINDVNSEVDLVREESDGTQIWNWHISVQFSASSEFFVRYEIWAYGPDENDNEKSYLVNSSVHKTDSNSVSLPDFWAYVIPKGDSPWSVKDIVHIERFEVRAVSNEDGSVLDKRDFMRNPR